MKEAKISGDLLGYIPRMIFLVKILWILFGQNLENLGYFLVE